MKIKIIHTTTDSKKIANDIAKYLVKDNLSPCVQTIHNVQSYYIWRGKLDKSDELLLIIKTLPKNVEHCKELILKYHTFVVIF